MGKGPCNDNYEGCPYEQSGCYSDIHHLHWPSYNYKTKIERKFRNLPANKERVCRFAHEILHLTQEPPEKPPVSEMMEAIMESGINLSRSLRRALDEMGREAS